MASRTESSLYVTGFPWCAKPVTPHDSNELVNWQDEPQAQTVLASVGGSIKVLPLGNAPGQEVTFIVTAGDVVPVLCRRVLATGTTASSLIGLY